MGFTGSVSFPVSLAGSRPFQKGSTPLVRPSGSPPALVSPFPPVAGRAAEINIFLPKETDVGLSLNVRQVLDSPLIKKHALELIKTTLASSKEAQEAIKALGLDPLTDFSRVSVGVGLEDVNHP